MIVAWEALIDLFWSFLFRFKVTHRLGKIPRLECRFAHCLNIDFISGLGETDLCPHEDSCFTCPNAVILSVAEIKNPIRPCHSGICYQFVLESSNFIFVHVFIHVKWKLYLNISIHEWPFQCHLSNNKGSEAYLFPCKCYLMVQVDNKTLLIKH